MLSVLDGASRTRVAFFCVSVSKEVFCNYFYLVMKKKCFLLLAINQQVSHT